MGWGVLNPHSTAEKRRRESKSLNWDDNGKLTGLTGRDEKIRESGLRGGGKKGGKKRAR